MITVEIIGDLLKQAVPDKKQAFCSSKKTINKWYAPMTMCAAAICKHYNDDEKSSIVLTISDRMFTSTDIEFEPQSNKTKGLTDRIVCLFAGHRNFHHMILEATKRSLGNVVVSVADAADAYANQFNIFRTRRAQDRYLTPLGLTYESFLTRQHEFNPATAERILNQIWSERIGVEAIIAGTDSDGAHIYTVAADSDEMTTPECHNDRGFAAIGTGRRQFESQFMFNCYTPQSEAHSAFWMMCSAKNLAESSPGVGSQADATMVTDEIIEFQQVIVDGDRMPVRLCPLPDPVKTDEPAQ